MTRSTSDSVGPSSAAELATSGLQRRDQVAAGGEAVVRVLGEAGRDDALEPRRHPGRSVDERDRLVAHDRGLRLDRRRVRRRRAGRSASRRRSGRRRTGRSARPRAGPTPAPATCSRPCRGSSPRASRPCGPTPVVSSLRHRSCGASSRARPRQAEVEDLGPALGRDHHVLRLEVAVDDALGVGGGEAVGDLARERERVPDRQRARGEDLAQRLPLDPLHRDPGDSRPSRRRRRP